MKRLDLSDGLKSIVFKKLVNIFKTNPVLKRTIKPTSWYVWDGRPETKIMAFGSGELPAIRMTPMAEPAVSMTNVRFESPFSIQIETAIDGTDICDAFNLWDAIHYAVFPGDGSKTCLAQLQAAAAASVPPLVGQNVIQLYLGTPAFTPSPQGLPDDMILATGNIVMVITVPR